MDDDDILAVPLQEAARRLSFEDSPAGAQRVYRLVTSGKLRGIKMGRAWRVPVVELHRYVAGGAA